VRSWGRWDMASRSHSLLELCSVIVDNRGKTCPVGDAGRPLIATNCVKNTALYPSYQTERFVSDETYASWFRAHPKPADLIFVTKGSPGQVCIAPDPVDFCIAQDMVALRANESLVYPPFLFALLRSSETQNQIGNMHVGSLIPHFKKGDFDKLFLNIPEEHEQIFIGDFYLRVSERIHRLNNTNDLLESIARSIFKSWFVDFDPVRAKAEGREPEGMDAATTSFFPCAFQESELGRIPLGWSTPTIKDLTCSIQYGFTTSANSQEVGPKFLRITDIQGGRVNWNTVPYCSASESERDRYRLRPHDIVVARTGASTGENIYLPVVPDAVFASYLVRFQFAQSEIARLVGEFMRTLTYFDFVQNSIGGSAQPNASAQVLAGAQLVRPPQALSRKYAEIVTTLDQKRCQNSDQITTLADLRDTLLPRLISGKLRVPEAEKLIEAGV
jgi:type I restriction enzyme S subunit